MNILIACEESQAVCKAFRDKGHEAYSCDLQTCSGGHPEWHICGNVLNILNGGIFITESFKEIHIDKWDMMIGHPECKYLCFSGERWLTDNPDRMKLRIEAFDFFMQLYNAPIPKIVIENSHSVYLNKKFRKPNQTVHPYHFGHPYKKSICLWLKNTPPLFHQIYYRPGNDTLHVG